VALCREKQQCDLLTEELLEVLLLKEAILKTKQNKTKQNKQTCAGGAALTAISLGSMIFTEGFSEGKKKRMEREQQQQQNPQPFLGW